MQNFIFNLKLNSKEFDSGMNNAGKAVDGAKEKVKGLGDEAQKAGGKIKDTAGDVSSLGSSLNKLAGSISAAFSVNQIISFGKKVAELGAVFDNLQIRLNSVAGGVREGQVAMVSLEKTAIKLGIDLKVLTENYINFMTAAKSSGMNISVAERAFKSMNVAMAGAGLSAQSQTQVFNSLQMMIGKTSISSMQLRQVFMQMPESFDVMAKTMGVTHKELHKMMQSGEIMAGDILPKFAKNMELALGSDSQKIAESLQGQLANLENSWDKLYKTVADTGAVQFSLGVLIESINGITISVEHLSNTFNKNRKVQNDINATISEANENSKEFVALQLERGKSVEHNIKIIENEIKVLTQEYETATGFARLRTAAQVKALEKELNAYIVAQNTKKELSDAEIKELQKLEAQRIKMMNNERLASAELAVLLAQDDDEKLMRQIEQIETRRDIDLQNTELTESQKKVIIQKAQNDVLKVVDELGVKKQKVIDDAEKERIKNEKSSYEESKKELRYKHETDVITTEEYYAELLALADKYNDDVRPILADEFKYRKKLQEEADKDAETAKKKQEQLDDDLRASKIQVATDTFELLSALNARYSQAQTEQLNKQLQQGIISQEAYEAQMRKIKRRQAVIDKAGALFQIGINTAINVSKNPPPSPLGILAIASGALQAATVIASPIPYNKGTKRVPFARGAVRGKDSVHAILTPNERVVPEDVNMQPGYSALMDLAQDRKISDSEAGFIADLATSGYRANKQSQTATIDYDLLGRSIAKYFPGTDVSIDRNGIAVISERHMNERRRLSTRL